VVSILRGAIIGGMFLSFVTCLERLMDLTMVVTTGIWSWVTIDLCKISTVELRLCEATDRTWLCETFWLLVILSMVLLSKTRSREYDGETLLRFEESFRLDDASKCKN
jgi:hypothetical protein